MTLSSIRDHCILVAVLLAASGCAQNSGGGALRIAAAADLQFALEDLIQEFHQAHPNIAVEPVYGSSGNFYTQIRNQAPFDMFLSASVDYAKRLEEQGLTAPHSLFTYALGRIVLWAPNSSTLDLPKLQMQALADPSVRHIAIANPQHAPYGQAAEAALRNAGIYDKISSRIVMGENIAQTLQLVQSGAADIGIVAMSLAVAPSVRNQGRYWEIPPDSYPKIEQAGVILAKAKDPKAAAGFKEFLTSRQARDRLKNFGFALRAE